MWNIITFYLPDWQIFMQGFIAFIIPVVISKIFDCIQTLEE